MPPLLFLKISLVPTLTELKSQTQLEPIFQTEYRRLSFRVCGLKKPLRFWGVSSPITPGAGCHSSQIQCNLELLKQVQTKEVYSIHCGAGLFLYDPLIGTLKIMFGDHVWELKPYL